VASGYSPLNFVDEAGNCVNGVILGLGSKLGYREEVVLFNVSIDVLGDDFLKEFASAFKESNWVIGLRDGVVRFLWFVDHDNRSSLSEVVSCG
jgi:hypothetical protein